MCDALYRGHALHQGHNYAHQFEDDLSQSNFCLSFLIPHHVNHHE